MGIRRRANRGPGRRFVPHRASCGWGCSFVELGSSRILCLVRLGSAYSVLLRMRPWLDPPRPSSASPCCVRLFRPISDGGGHGFSYAGNGGSCPAERVAAICSARGGAATGAARMRAAGESVEQACWAWWLRAGTRICRFSDISAHSFSPDAKYSAGERRRTGARDVNA